MREKTRLKVEGLVIGQRRDGKNRYDEAAKSRLMSLCAGGVASVAAIALANGVNPNVLHRWLTIERTRADVDAGAQETQLLPVVVAEENDDPRAASSCADAKSGDDAGIDLEIELARGTLRFRHPFDEKLLRLIASTLGPRC
jgi:transposase-like protein